MIEYSHVGADVETTGLDPRVEEVVEITVKEFNISGIKGETKSFLCRPKSGFIPREASDIHGITYEMVKEAANYLEDGIREQIASFVGDRTLVGHNIDAFDLKFMKITPKKTEDTLTMCRRRFPGRSNKLKTACARLGIEWDDSKSHRSGYDVDKTIELFIKLKNFEIKQNEINSEKPLFAAQIERDVSAINEPKKFGVLIGESDQNLIATQSYSYSRINLYKQCPFKWFMQYVKGFKQPDEDYLIVGSVMHKIAERSGEWCFRELFANKFVVWVRKIKFEINENIARSVSSYYNKEFSIHDMGRYLFENPKLTKDYVGVDGFYKFIVRMEQVVRGENYEVPAMPDLSNYEQIIQNAINQYKITDTSVITDVRRLAERFYRNANFSLLPGDIVLTEKRIAFDKEWKILSDFFANNAFFRAIIDTIYYFGRTIIVRDYKTSRTMEKEENLSDHMQLLIYALMIYKFIPRNTYDKIIVQIEYLRFGKIIKLEIEDVEFYADKALKWIVDAIQEIEKEMLKTDGGAFPPIRNQYCHTCHIGGDGRCPLFNKSLINNIEDPFNFIIDNIEDCVRAWKRVEVNKAENSRLQSLCKSFVNECESSVIIDEKAILDFYTSKFLEYDTLKTVQMLLKKNMPIEQIVSFMSFPASQFERFLEYKELKLTDEEKKEIAQEKTKTEFKACTPEEVQSKGYINS